MPVDQPGLKVDLEEAFNSEPQDTEESSVSISEAIAANIVDAVEQSEDFTTPSLGNSWVNFGGSYATAAYYKDGLGRVYLRGTIKDGSIPGVVFTLPAGYRPAAQLRFGVMSHGAFGRVDVYANGDVEVNLPSTNSSLSLDQVHFRAEQ